MKGPARCSSPRAIVATSVALVAPVDQSVAAQATTMKAAMRFVSNAPNPTSRRSPTRSSGPSRLSATYDWMKAWPHGVIVVPTVATTATQYPAFDSRCGITSELAAWPQSGRASRAEMKYAVETQMPTATKRYWTLL